MFLYHSFFQYPFSKIDGFIDALIADGLSAVD